MDWVFNMNGLIETISLSLALVPSIPDVVMPLDVYLVEDSFWWLQEVLLHLHGNIPGQQAH